MAEAEKRTYVLNTVAGEENRLLLFLRSGFLHPDEETYLPLIEMERKSGGVWQSETRVMFPGYVFVETCRPQDLYDRLKTYRTDQFRRLLFAEETFLPITREEEAWIQELCGADHIMQKSVGIIENGQLQILSGPLKRFASEIIYINRHKKKATIRLQLLGEERRVRVGLEVTRKS